MTDAASSEEHTSEFNPNRAREPRAQEVRRARRRRKGGTLTRMAQMKLDIFDPSQLDTANFVYRWCNDEENRLAILTRMDDYDFVGSSDLVGFNTSESPVDSESSERIRMIVGSNSGRPVYSYLLKKPRDYYEDDMEEGVRAREDMMAGRVFKADVEEDAAAEGHKGDPSKIYVPKTENVSIGGATERRRGPVARTKGL